LKLYFIETHWNR